MNLAELQSEVSNMTRRPDLLSSHITPAIKAATLKMHQADFFPKDLYEAVITFPTAEYVQAWNYTASVPRWRALKYMRKIDSTSGDPLGVPLTVLVPENLFDDYGVEKTNVAYEAGLFLNIKCSEEIQTFLMGCYVNPDITDAGFTSWIADKHPYAIVYEAAAKVFRQIGLKEQEVSMTNEALQQLAIIRQVNIQTVGY